MPCQDCYVKRVNITFVLQDFKDIIEHYCTKTMNRNLKDE